MYCKNVIGNVVQSLCEMDSGDLSIGSDIFCNDLGMVVSGLVIF
jgi:hypothetical protein